MANEYARWNGLPHEPRPDDGLRHPRQRSRDDVGTMMRWRVAIATIASIHMALAGFTMIAGGEHSLRELAAVELAIAVGGFSVAAEPRRAHAILPVIVVATVALSWTALVGMAGGSTDLVAESHLLLDLTAAGAVAAVAHNLPAQRATRWEDR